MDEVKVNYNDGRTSELASQTYGERAVGLSFNPAGSARVNRLKKRYAEVIDELVSIREAYKEEAKNASSSDEEAKNNEGVRLASIAITEAQGAQMWAVKAATWGL